MKQTYKHLSSKRYLYLAFIFLTGFTSLIYEIYSTRILFFFFTETNWAITIGITSFLAGIAFSSLFFASFAKKQTMNVFFILWIMQIAIGIDRKSTRLNSSHQIISYAVFCLKKKNI